MRKLDEETALAIIFANTKRKKRPNDLITVAKAFNYLVKLYGTPKIVAEKVSLSTVMIREFISILKLPKEIQKLISERRIDSIDTLGEILALEDPSKQINAAEMFIDSSSKDVRDIKRLIKMTNISVKDAKKTILDAKPKGMHIFIMDFDDETYESIIKYAKTLKIKPAELVKRIITEWLKQKINEIGMEKLGVHL